jgi:ABC-2 type transport system permease protein
LAARLLAPRLRGLRNQWVRGSRGERLSWALFFGVGLVFWVLVFVLLGWLVLAFSQVEVFGPILARKLLELLLVGLFGALCFSNVVTALSTFYLSDDLELLLSLPVSRAEFHLARSAETLAQSSWMVLVFGLPVFAAYGYAYDAGLLYFGLVALVLPAFVLLPNALGIGVATLLVSVFPARRLREALVFAALVGLVVVFIVMRFARPERLLNASSFDSLAAYVAELQAPVPLLLPPRWASDVLLASLMGRPIPWIELGLLCSGAIAMAGLSRWLTAALYDGGRGRAQEARVARLVRAGWLDRLLAALTSPLPPIARAVVRKDVKTFFRDPAQWSQLFLVASIVVIALASVWALPVDAFRGPWLGAFRSALAFMVLGLVGFVMAAIAVRFQFTAVAIEGRAFWIVRVSPVDPRDLLLAKLWPTLPLIVVVGQVLALVSCGILGASLPLTSLAAGGSLGLAFALSGLAVGMGAMYPDFKADNAARAAAGPAAVLYMVTALSLVGVVVGLLAAPAWVVLAQQTTGDAMTAADGALAVVPLVAALLLCIAATVLPIRLGARRLWARELPNG